MLDYRMAGFFAALGRRLADYGNQVFLQSFKLILVEAEAQLDALESGKVRVKSVEYSLLLPGVSEE